MICCTLDSLHVSIPGSYQEPVDGVPPGSNPRSGSLGLKPSFAAPWRTTLPGSRYPSLPCESQATRSQNVPVHWNLWLRLMFMMAHTSALRDVDPLRSLPCLHFIVVTRARHGRVYYCRGQRVVLETVCSIGVMSTLYDFTEQSILRGKRRWR